MTAATITTDDAPTAMLRTPEDLPLVDLGDGSKLQLLNVDLAQGVWTILTAFVPGATITTHFHTGSVHAFTRTGSWWYLESPDEVNTPGSYLYEPAGSKHTLHVPETNDGLTEVWFTIHGANINLEPDGTVSAILDAATVYNAYKLLCGIQHGLTDPPVIVTEAR